MCDYRIIIGSVFTKNFLNILREVIKMKDIKAIFCDGNVIVGGVKRSAGKYSKILLNAFTDKKGEYIIEKKLEKEYTTIMKALESLLCPEMLIDSPGIAKNLINCLSAIKVLFPFNVSDEILKTTELFSDKNIHVVNILKQSRTDNPHELWEKYPELSDAQFVIRTVEIESEMKDCLLFFENITHDISKAYSEMKEFADTYSEMQKHYENDLLPVAVDLLNNWNISELKTRYITVLSKKGKKTLGREMIFTSYRDFIIADLFEGIHYGHYTRQCIICEKYFLMEKAFNQKVCGGKTTIKKTYSNDTYSCAEYAQKTKRNDRADSNPIKKIYEGRLSQLRRSRNRGLISDEFYEAAKAIAKEYLKRTDYDKAYAESAYKTDMTQEEIYKAVERKLRNV